MSTAYLPADGAQFAYGVEASAFIWPGDTDHAPAIQRAADALIAAHPAGGTVRVDDSVTWNLASRIFVDYPLPFLLRFQATGRPTFNFANDANNAKTGLALALATVNATANVGEANLSRCIASLTSGSPTFKVRHGSFITFDTQTLAGGAADGMVLAGTAWPNGTRVVSIAANSPVAGVDTVTVSQNATATGTNTFRVQRPLFSVGCDRTTGDEKFLTGSTAGKVIFEDFLIDLAGGTDHDNLAMFVFAAGLRFHAKNVEVDHLYRGFLIDADYNDNIVIDNPVYIGRPCSGQGSGWLGNSLASVTNASISGTTATFTLGALPSPNYVVGDTVIVGNISGASGKYKGAWIVDSVPAGSPVTFTAHNGSNGLATLSGLSGSVSKCDESVAYGWYYRQSCSGDGLHVRTSRGGTGDGLVNLSSCNGGVIDGVISAAMRFSSCRGIVISGYHWDSNQTDGLASAMYSSNSHLTFLNPWWHGGPGKVNGTQGFLAVQRHFLTIDDSDGESAAEPALGSEIVIINPAAEWRYNYNEDTRYPDINILSANPTTRLAIEEPRYGITKQFSGGDSIKAAASVWVGSYTDGNRTEAKSFINTQAALARSIMAGSFEFSITGNAGSAPDGVGCKFRSLHGQDVIERAATAAPTIVETANAASGGASGTTLMAGATAASTHYCVAVIRNEGVLSTSGTGFSVASADYQPTNTAANKVNELLVTMPDFNVWGVVLWKKAAASAATSPSHYVVLPFKGLMTVLRDSGTRVNGRAWLTTPSVPVPTTVAASNFTYDLRISRSGRRVAYGTAPPSSSHDGPWSVSDIMWNSAATLGGAAGWMCTVAGSPGTWKAMANLA